MLKHLNLGQKFTLILSIVFVAGMALGGIALWKGLEGRAEAEVTAKGLMLIGAMRSVREYTSTQVAPLLADKLKASPTFIKETVPAFSASSVFEKFRKDPAYAPLTYKEAALNPSNPQNLADDFETQVLNGMISDPNTKSLSGFRVRDNKWVYYTAWPLRVTAPSCLACHTTPEEAPKNLVASYGSLHGFGWKLNQIVAAQMIYVPADEVVAAARRSFGLVMGIFAIVIAIAILVINFLLKRDVIQPIANMADLARRVSADEMVPADVEVHSSARIAKRLDELGQSARVFRQMATDVCVRTERLKQQVQELRIEIDDVKRQQRVSDVVETDFFRQLQTLAQELRDRRQQEGDTSEEDSPKEDTADADHPKKDAGI